MNFDYTPKVEALREKLLAFFDEYIYPNESVYHEEVERNRANGNAWVPTEIVEKLNTEINKTINLPAVKDAWAKQGAFPMPMSTAEFDKYLRADIEKWAKVVKSAGIKVN